MNLKLPIATAVLLMGLFMAGQTRAQTVVDSFDPNANAAVRVIVVQPDGKILIGGDFTTLAPNGGPAVTRNHIARLNPDGTLDTAFNPNANSSVHAIAVQADGKILVGGDFSTSHSEPATIGGQTRNFIARLDPTTGLADSFNPNANDIVWSIAVQPDGKILAAGYFAVIGGQTRNRIARLDPTTGLADSFNPDVSVGIGIYAIALQGDGKILVGGPFLSIGGQTRHSIARLDPTTGLADSFDPNATNWVQSIAVQADGKILAAGIFHGDNSIGGQTRNYIARLDPTTGLADSFNPNANDWVYSIALQPDGKILAGGAFTSIGGQTRRHIARLYATNGLADSFDPNGDATCTQFCFSSFVYSIAVQPDGKILAGTNFSTFAPNGGPIVTRNNIARFVFLPPAFGNISTRGGVETGDNAMIGGFIITGTQLKTVVVRGIGPSLGIPGALADPIIEVHGPSGELLGSNDNWRDDPNHQHVIDNGLAPTNESESALWGIINSGSYTVIVRGKNDSVGIGVFEAYDVDQTADSRLANVSTRGLVRTGDNVLIGGVIVAGQNSRKVIVRAIGPSLSMAGRLDDPFLELHDNNGALIVTNDNWRTDQEAEIIATTIPPSDNRESAIVRDLVPGNYTAVVRGVNNSTGIAVVEAYALD